MFGSLLFGPSEDHLSASDREGLKARRLAAASLSEVIAKRQPLDESFDRLAGSEPYSSLPARDRAFARAMVATALRRKGQLGVIIKTFIEKPLPEKRGSLDAILLCAAAQLVFLKTPAHAVINLAVHQVRGDPQARRFSKLANAVLRRISEKGAAIALAQDAARLNTPDWLWESWTGAYGGEAAMHIAAQHLCEPPLDLTVKSNAEGWARRLGGVELPTGSIRLPGKGRVNELEGFSDGEWWVQDAAASLPARLLGDVRGKNVADLCAAPGGKTAQLAHAGAHVTALDLSEKRLTRLGENLKRLKLEAELETGDLLNWQPGKSFDAILLDAPCSSTGTIRRNPDIPYLKRPDDIPPLAELQKKMLERACELLRPGGVMVYCTCSLERAEGPEQVAGLLARRSEIRIQPVEPHEIGSRPEWLDDYGGLRTLPHFLQLSDPDLTGMDGFYAIRLVKRG